MAKLTPPTASGPQLPLAPAGQHTAVCFKIEDQFGVERASFDNPAIKELKDVTRFTFGFLDARGQPQLVQSFEFGISGNPKSNLMKFLLAWLGSAAPMGWDYCEMKGRGAMMNIQHVPSKKQAGVVYANIASISPVPSQMAGYVPPMQQFEAYYARLEAAAGLGQAPAAPHAPAAPYAPPAPPMAPQAPFAPPPPPAPVGRTFYAFLNGVVQELPESARATLPAGTKTMELGAQVWVDHVPAAAAPSPFPPAAPAAPLGNDSDVPF